ncbi:hypothetical protein [Conexibacter sp. SYSU D00693]|uniref:hypothetical protein n=1 Tax=Conexibacter sp. SYSU D00693 TaxID=2812560 RepID=UPI00196B194E|nr:hypothetical protein [Conexibacter sp. SYSU D00693]
MESSPPPERPDPDHTEDPREQQTGSSGYPESQEQGSAPSEGTRTGPERNVDDEDAPSPSSGKEADREASTGNPDAAG